VDLNKRKNRGLAENEGPFTLETPEGRFTGAKEMKIHRRITEAGLLSTPCNDSKRRGFGYTEAVSV